MAEAGLLTARTAGLARVGLIALLLGLSVALLAGRPSAETPGVTTRESVVSGTTDGDGDGPSENVAISADGRFVAFESLATNLVDGIVEGPRRVFLRDRETLETSVVPGPSGVTVRETRSPSVSADGSFVAFEADVDRPPVELIDWRTQLDLLAYTVPVFDGTTMIHIAGNLGQGVSGINFFDADRGDDANPVFSPDRRWLAFTRGGEIWVRPIDPGGGSGAGATRQVTNSPEGTISTQPAWSPDGSRIVFSRQLADPAASLPTGLYTIDVENGEELQLTNNIEELEVDQWPDWSPDGRWIAFSGTRSHDGLGDQPSIFVVEVAWDDGDAFAGDLSRVTSGAFADTQPRWHPWRETLAFTRVEESGLPSKIWVTDVVSAPILLEEPPRRPTGSAGDVSAAEFVEGANTRALTFDEGNDSRPAWTGEGLGVSFVSDRNGVTDADVYTQGLGLDLQPSGPVELASGGSGPITLPPGVVQSPHHAPITLGLDTPAGAEARVLGVPGGPAPEGSLRFEVFPCQAPDLIGCIPDAARTRQLGGLAPLVDGGAESLVRTSELTPPYDYGLQPDLHCIAADYSGDGFYRTTRLIDPDEGCFYQGRIEPTVELEPGEGGVVARVSGPPGTPAPTGLVSFFLCGPDPGATPAGCLEGGEQVDWVEPLVGGTAGVFPPSGLAPGRYCWRAEYAGDFSYHPRSATGTSSPACFVVAPPSFEPVLSGRIFIPTDFEPGSAVGLNAIFAVGDDYTSEYDVAGSPGGRGVVSVCGPDEVGPYGCVEGGTVIADIPLTLGGSSLHPVEVPPALTGEFGTYCLRLDYRYGPGAGPEQDIVEKSVTNTVRNTAVSADDGLCFEVVHAAFDSATARTSVFRYDRVAGTVELVSVALDGAPNGNSYDPSISGDGSRVAFTSQATNLTTDPLLTDDGEGSEEEVFLRDLAAGVTSLVSVHQASCPDEVCFGGSNEPSISADGQSVAFTTNAAHLQLENPPDPDFLIGEFTQVVVRELAASTSTVESVGPAGQAGFGNSSEPSLSGDGSRVAFTSEADDLVPIGDDLFFDDVFVRDRAAGETLLVSAGVDVPLADSPSGEPSISTDGRTVAFSSFATNLVADHPCVDSSFSGCPRSEVFVRDTVRNNTGMLSVDPDGVGVEEPWNSSGPAVAGIGRFVAFESENPQLVAGDGNELSDVFVRDRTPVLLLTPDPVDFGEQLVGQPSDVATVVATNAGSGPLELGPSFASSETSYVFGLTAGDTGDFTFVGSDCVSPGSPEGVVLHRADTCTIEFVFTPQAEGPRSAVLSVQSSDPGGEPVGVRHVTLVGVGTRALAEVTPDPVDVGGWPVGVLSDPAVATFVSVGSAPVTVDSVALAGANPGDFEIADDGCSGQTLLSLEGCGVTVRFRATVEGPRQATLVFTDDAEGSPHSVTLVGRGLEPEVDVTPDPVEFGEQELGTTSEAQEVTFLHVLGDPVPGVVQEPVVQVSAVAVEGSDSGDFTLVDNCTAAVLDPGEACSVGVRFSPTVLGERTAQLTFVDTAPGSPRSVTLVGTGVSPEVPVGLLEVTPDVIDYGVIPEGETGPVTTVTARNVGTGSVTLANLTLAGSGAARYRVPPEGDGCSGTTLLPGTSCGVAVIFAPDVTGAHAAVLQVPSDASNAPHAADLTGLAPLLEPDPALGPPGFVPEILGSDFPPNTELVIAWEPGIGSRTITTDDEGSFSLFLPVLRRDQIGPRTVEARGDGFTIVADFLVVPGTLQPGEFASRR